MIFNKLDTIDTQELEITKNTPGWLVAKRMVNESIEAKNKAILGFDWKYDEDGQPNKKTVIEFQKIQMELEVLKSFLLFMDKPVIMAEKKLKDVYE